MFNAYATGHVLKQMYVKFNRYISGSKSTWFIDENRMHQLPDLAVHVGRQLGTPVYDKVRNGLSPLFDCGRVTFESDND